MSFQHAHGRSETHAAKSCRDARSSVEDPQSRETFLGTTTDLSRASKSPKLARSHAFTGSDGWQGLCSSGGVRPLVSFVIPVRNDAVRLQRCLASIVRNDYPARAHRDDRRRQRLYGWVGARRPRARRHRAARPQTRPWPRCATAARVRRSAASSPSSIRITRSIRSWIETAVDVLSDANVAATGAAYLTQPEPQLGAAAIRRLRSRPARPRGRGVARQRQFRRQARRRSSASAASMPSLTACEDVDLCNRLRLAGHRIVADPAIAQRSFRRSANAEGALLRRAVARPRQPARDLPRSAHLRHLRSALVPVAELICLDGGVVALLFGAPIIAAALPARRARAVGNPGGAASCDANCAPASSAAAQALAVAVVFDLARALALLARGSHRARRAA